jgi:hypothetical protein
MSAGTRVEDIFCVPLHSPCEGVSATAPEVLVPCARSFEKNIAGVCAALNLPYFLSVSGEVDRRFQLLFSAESIRQLKYDHQDLDNADREAARRRAEARFRESMADRATLEQAASMARRRLYELASSDTEVQQGARELLRQGAVLAWGSFEVFVSDAVTALADSDPQIALRLIRSQSPAVRRLVNADIALETVLLHQGDLRGRFASLMFGGDARIDSLPLMKSIMDELFPSNSDLRTALGDRALWILFQRRHLIVHRRGVVDARYREDTGEDLSVGSELEITQADVRKYVETCVTVARALLKAASQ